VTVDDRRRLELFDAARTQLGEGPAGTLMELLPVPGDELATRQDLALTRAELRAEMAELRTEMADLRTDLRTEMAELRTDLRTEMAELRTEMHDLFREQTTRILLVVVPTMLSGVGLAFAAARI